TGAGIGGYNRWIDRLSYTYLTDAMRVPQDPELVTIAGVLRAQDGFDAPEVNLVGLLLPAYQFEGLPDLEQMPYDEPSGAGFFAIHLETGQGDRIYRFDPWFRTVPGGGGEVAFFAFAVEWDSAMQAISLHGPSYPADPFQSQDQELFRINRTPTIPNVGPMTATTSAGRQPHPVVAPGQDVTISWSAGDGDADDLRATLLLKPADSATWFPYGIHLDGTEFTIPGAQLAGRPGSYDARLLVTDGVNTAQVEEQDLFTVTAGVRIYLPMVVKR
ncbi:MAG: hypothetical protein JXA93_08755, partial [Anaerolineae bacterium]|nr:hypothetical protein [Anaerolineae bacterium]